MLVTRLVLLLLLLELAIASLGCRPWQEERARLGAADVVCRRDDAMGLMVPLSVILAARTLLFQHRVLQSLQSQCSVDRQCNASKS